MKAMKGREGKGMKEIKTEKMESVEWNRRK